MIHATIYIGGEYRHTTVIETSDAFKAMLWAHRMGYNVLESAGTSAKLETDAGVEGLLVWSFINP